MFSYAEGCKDFIHLGFCVGWGSGGVWEVQALRQMILTYYMTLSKTLSTTSKTSYLLRGFLGKKTNIAS